MKKTNNQDVSSIQDILKKQKEKAEEQRNWVVVIRNTAIVLLIAVVFLHVFFGIGYVRGDSMYPIFHDGDILLYNRLDKDVTIGDVVVYKKYAGRDVVKRVVGTPGDIIDIDEATHKLMVNQHESTIWVATDTYPAKDSTISYPLELKEGEIFLLGDNRTESMDSRSYGAVLQKNIAGVVIMKLSSDMTTGETSN